MSKMIFCCKLKSGSTTMYLFFTDFDKIKETLAVKISDMLQMGCFAEFYISEVDVDKGPYKCRWVDVTDEISVHIDCLTFRQYFPMREQIDDNTIIFSSSLSRFQTKQNESSVLYINLEPIESEQDYIEASSSQSTFSLCSQVVNVNNTLVVT